MLNLIKNEWIKVMKKKSNWALFIIMFILLVGVIIISDLFSSDSGVDIDEYGDSSNMKETYERSLEYLKDSKDEESKKDIKLYKFLLDNKLYNGNDWKVKALEKVSRGEKKQYDKQWEKICEIVKKDDYNEYLEYKGEVYEENEYKCEILKEAICNPYKFLFDKKIKYKDNKTKQVFSLVNIQDKLEQYSKKNDSSSKMMQENYVKKYLILKYELEEDENAISELDFSSENVYDVEDEQEMATDIYSGVDDVFSKRIDFWSDFFNSSECLLLFGMVMLVIASNSVASEFSKGTIKFLIINPKKRGKIIISKYLNLLLISSVGTIIFYMLNFIVILIINCCRLRTIKLGIDYLYVSNGSLHKISPFFKVLADYGLGMVGIVMVMTLAFAISSLAKNSTLATCIGVAVFLGGNTVTLILSELNVFWGRYFFFANTQLLEISKGSGSFYGMTLIGAISNLVIHWIILMMTAYDGFVRREV